MKKLLLVIISLSASTVWAQLLIPINGYSQQSTTHFLSVRTDSVGQLTGPYCKTLDGAPCGISFKVDGLLTLVESGPGNYKAKPPGTLKIEVSDSLTEKKPLEFDFDLDSGAVSYYHKLGATVLTFKDRAGTLIISGDLQGRLFSGSLIFSDGTEQRGLGQFSTDVCNIFSCIDTELQ